MCVFCVSVCVCVSADELSLSCCFMKHYQQKLILRRRAADEAQTTDSLLQKVAALKMKVR